MTEADAWAIEAFVDAHTAKWRRMAGATNGDHDEHDVTSAARLKCHEWLHAAGTPLDWGDAQLVDRFMAHLHCELVEFTEKLHRGAVRLDHPRQEVTSTATRWPSAWPPAAATRWPC